MAFSVEFNAIYGLTWANVVINANSDRLGGLQCFLPASWQHTFGKQSNVLLHTFGCKS